MSNLTIFPTNETMSSREIAKLYCKPHSDTLKKIRKLEKAYIKGFGNEGKFSFVKYRDTKGELRPEILLNKSQTLFVASRFDDVLHAKIQKRWEDLETKAREPQPLRPPIELLQALNNPAAMRGILLTYTEKVLTLEKEVKESAPKVAGFDLIANSDGLTCITDTAKSLQIRPTDLFGWLSQNKWIYRRRGGKGWVAYQDKIQQGLLSHRVTTIQTSDGREKIIESVLVTPKGLAKLSKVFMEVAV